MLKKCVLLLLLALCLSASVQAFTGTVNLSQKAGGATRTLTLSKWSVDKRGVPSFDYRYEQSGAGCGYARSGRAVAGFEDNGDSVELQVFSGQGEDGKEGPPMTIFYDHHDDVILSLTAGQKSSKVWVSFEDAVMKKKFPKRCGFSAEDAAAIFKN